ncbi:MAG: hypothetical protein MH252_01560 [Thermosynechococcaceae cyanobacterium MS004]|nr:hypothetical protein [Thermosynechococcaceae cyanobacterium MS004]
MSFVYDCPCCQTQPCYSPSDRPAKTRADSWSISIAPASASFSRPALVAGGGVLAESGTAA